MKFLNDLVGKKIKKVEYYGVKDGGQRKPYESVKGFWTPYLRKIVLEDGTEITPSDTLNYPGIDVFKSK